jgi:hypothetical protein
MADLRGGSTVGGYPIADTRLATSSKSGLLANTDKAILDAATSTTVANTLVKRDGNGDFSARYMNATYFNMGAGVDNSQTLTNIIIDNGDGYLRKVSLSTFQNKLTSVNADQLEGIHSTGFVQNGGSTPSITTGADSSKGSAGTSGRLYVSTDGNRIYRDTGSTWQIIGTVNWSDLSGKPTTVGASGLTDALSTSWAGSTNITTVGTIGSGTWQATAISPSYIATNSSNRFVTDTNIANWGTAYSHAGSTHVGLTGANASGTWGINISGTASGSNITGSSLWNADGDGAVFVYSDNNPTYNGVAVGAVVTVRGDGADLNVAVRAKIFDGTLINSINGYYIGTFTNLTTGNNTTQVIDSSGNWVGGTVAWAKITGAPTSYPASDVYAWAKASTKPSYTYSEVGAAPSSHNHTYNVNDAWFRDNGDDANVKLYGNTRQMVFRTDGTTEYATGIGGYAFVYMYGGDGAASRIILINSTGDIWSSSLGNWFSSGLGSSLTTSGNTILLKSWGGSTLSTITAPYASSAGNADTLDNIHSSGFVQTTYNSSLNSDSRNSRGVTRLYRIDDNSDYSVQTNWTGSYWKLSGYNGDTAHAGCYVAYADSAGSVSWDAVSGKPSLDNYGYWILQGAGANASNVTSGTTINFVGAGATTVSKTGNTVTITSTDTNTDTNTWRPISDSVTTTDSGTSASLTAVKTAYDLAASKWTFSSSAFAAASTVSFPGFAGTGSAGTASRSDHTHSYLTSESDTLATVTNRGSTTSNGISVGSLSATTGGVSIATRYYTGLATGTATFVSNWASSAYFGIGSTGVNDNTIKLGICDNNGNWTATDPIVTIGSSNYVVVHSGNASGYVNHNSLAVGGTAVVNSSREAGFTKVTINQNGTTYGYGLLLYNSTNWWDIVQGGDNRLFFGYNGATKTIIDTSGNMTVAGDLITYSTSDKRLKTDIHLISNSLEKLDKIRGVEFNWDPSAKKLAQKEGHDYGVIAQEVEEVLPLAVKTRETGYKAVDYQKIIPLLIQAVKELRTEVKKLRGE